MNRIFIIVLLLLSSGNCIAQQKRFSFSQPKMGSPFSIIFYADDSMQANLLARQSFALVDSFVLIFSDYVEDSELSELSATAGSRGGGTIISPAMFDMLLLAKNAFDKSSGTFDITIGPLSKFWRKCRKTKIFPTYKQVKSVQKLIGFNKLVLDTIYKKVTLIQPGMQLDLGGIAQGYIAQKIIDFLYSQHISRALVNASGDIVVSGAPPGLKGWTVGINIPESMDELLPGTILLNHKAITTSGDAFQFMEHNGKRYSHIIDPHTGYGVTYLRNVTAIANDGVTADWLATACSILSVKKATQLATQLGAEIYIGEIKNGKLIFYSTKDFNRYWKQ